ncbi:septation protein SepH [Leifsonia bigeumensis]|uniref:Septation protein SepH n=1 Tax=Leifsonella bigeumensis TaxID=433643 RepID=A0ABP7FS48_9MICO
MQELRVIGVEDGALLATSDEGERYRIAVDDALRSRLRQSPPDAGSGRRLAPKDIQAHIRAGLSAQDVASITGASLEYIQRFEGPVIAEREYVIESALAVPVHTAMDTELSDVPMTFGTAILGRLHELGAIDERWASWKEEGSGWVVKLSFTAETIDHDARWRFDPKKSALAPLNSEAETLSRQGEPTGSLIPRLRAVDGRDRVADNSRFDSGAFVDHELAGRDSSIQDTAPHLEAVPYGRIGAAPTATADESQEEVAPSNQTADLLEALRRRRGERESAQYDDLEDAKSDHPSTGSIRLVEVPLPDLEDDEQPTAPQPAVSQSSTVPSIHQRSSKKGRAAMPSWDEIVFGARSDDDPA